MERLSRAELSRNRSFERNAYRYNKTRIPLKIKAGDLVIEWTKVATKVDQGVHEKISLPGMGPYKVSSIDPSGNTLVLVDPKGHIKESWIVNASRVRKFQARPSWMRDPATDSTTDDKEFDSEDLEDKDFSPEEEERLRKINLEIDKLEDELRTLEEEQKEKPPERLNTGDVITKQDLYVGAPVDLFVKGSWLCGTIHKTRNKPQLQIYIAGKNLNDWVSPYKLRKCTCINKQPKKATKAEARKVAQKKYWKL
jgi:hypothetical protein